MKYNVVDNSEKGRELERERERESTKERKRNTQKKVLKRFIILNIEKRKEEKKQNNL